MSLTYEQRDRRGDGELLGELGERMAAGTTTQPARVVPQGTASGTTQVPERERGCERQRERGGLSARVCVRERVRVSECERMAAGTTTQPARVVPSSSSSGATGVPRS